MPRLYTYIDSDADISKGLLSARLAPESSLLKRYGSRGFKSKKQLLDLFNTMPGHRAEQIYALDAPIPDNAYEKLRRFREGKKLVSFDTSEVPDIVKILRKYNKRVPEQVDPNNFLPLKYVQWKRIPKNGLTFKYAPCYKIRTESGRIAPELLREETMNDKYTIHGAILGCLGKHAKDFDYKITEKLPNDPWKAIINTGPMSLSSVRKFHKYHNVDVDKKGVPYYFLTKNQRTGDKAVWYSDDSMPIPINTKQERQLAKQIGVDKGLVPAQLDFKF